MQALALALATCIVMLLPDGITNAFSLLPLRWYTGVS